MFEIKLIEKIENDYDPNLCCNGGSYYQLSYTYEVTVMGAVFTLKIDDSSCGDFGRRYDVRLVSKRDPENDIAWANVDYTGATPREESNFYRFPLLAAQVECATGYRVLFEGSDLFSEERRSRRRVDRARARRLVS